MPQMSQVLRERAIGMLTAGMSTRAVARELNVHFSTISRLQRRFREFGSTSNQPHNRRLEADIFSGIPRVTGIPRESRGMGNKIATNHVIGTGQEKMPAGVGGTGNSNDIPNFIHKYTFYINKL